MDTPKATRRIKIHVKVFDTIMVCQVLSTILDAPRDWTLRRFRAALAERINATNDDTFQIKCGDESWDFLSDITRMRQLVTSDVCLTISHVSNLQKNKYKKKKKKKGFNLNVTLPSRLKDLNWNADLTSRTRDLPDQMINLSHPKTKTSKAETYDSSPRQYTTLYNPSNPIIWNSVQSQRFSSKPTNDKTGNVVCLGSMSQYCLPYGRSACTSICIIAAFQFLTCSNLNEFDAFSCDAIVMLGIEKNLGYADVHSDLDTLWKSASFSEEIKLLMRLEAFQGYLFHPSQGKNSFFEALRRILPSPNQRFRQAFILTTSGESVLLFSLGTTIWYLFDSHGQSHEVDKRAYIKSFESLQSLCDTLIQKYPYFDFERDKSLLSEMYNTFEFYPIVLRADKNIEKNTFHQSPKLNASFNVTTKPDTDHDLENALPSLKSPQFHDALVEKVDILDPIMKQVMADPVKCHDGFTYDRCSIEHYFAVRKEEQVKRMKVLQHGENTEISNEEAVTCSGKLLPIELLSPMTQQALPSEVLLPDLNMESLIVRAMERKVFSLTEDDIADWNTRRAEKRKADDQRESQQRKSHDQEILAPEEGNHKLASCWMRMDRDIRYNDRKLGGNDLGISVSLCMEKDRITEVYVKSCNQELRCMVACCSVFLREPRWCSRCGRLSCCRCLNFGVTEISAMDASCLMSICFECATQITDSMVFPETSSTPSGIFIQENIILKYLNELINDASECQHILVRNQYAETHVKLVELHRHEIQMLEWNRDFLREKVKALKESVSKVLENEESEAQCEEHFDEDNINHLQREYFLMQMRLAEFQEMEIPDDEEEQIQFVIDREQIYNQVEDLEAKLIEARSELLARISPSRVLPQTIQSRKVDVPKNSSILSLISEFTRCLECSNASLDVQACNLKSTKVLSSIELEHFWPWYEKFWTATRGADARNKTIGILREFPDVFQARFSKEISAVVTELEGDLEWQFPELNGASSMLQETILMISDLDNLPVEAAPAKGDIESSIHENVASCEARLSALGKWSIPWTLPLGLEYPTDRMKHQFRTVENALKSKLVESERHWENFFAEKIKSLIDMRNELEALVEMLDVEANAVELAAVEERRQKREIERQRKEADRSERERQRQLRERQAQEEKKRLQKEERLTNELFKNAAKNHSANYFGGSGDLRMCPQCQAGPVENRYCNDLSTHNRPETSWKGITVEKHDRPNACPNCGYFSGNWHDWRYWDGIFGPH